VKSNFILLNIKIDSRKTKDLNKCKEVAKLKSVLDCYFNLKEQHFPINSSKDFAEKLKLSLKIEDMMKDNSIILTETFKEGLD
jgi:hypothetical protein